MMQKRKPLASRDYAKLSAWAAQGWRLEDAARELGYSRRTLSRLLEEDERARESWEEGRGIEHQALVGALFQAATKGNGQSSVVAAIFLLKARHGYRENAPLEVEHNVRVTVELPAALSADQYRRVIEVNPQAVRAVEAEAGEVGQ